jgi:hypothetical protein
MSVGQLIRREDRKICFLRITTRVMRSPAPAHPTSLKTNPIILRMIDQRLCMSCHRLSYDVIDRTATSVSTHVYFLVDMNAHRV